MSQISTLESHIFGPEACLPPPPTGGVAAVTTLHAPAAPRLQELEQTIHSNQDEVTLLKGLLKEHL